MMAELIRCPKCHSLISDATDGNKTYRCPNCGNEFETGISLEAESFSEHKARRSRAITIFVFVLAAVVLVAIYLGISPILSSLSPLHTGDVCYVRDGFLCEEKYCGGKQMHVSDNTKCTIEKIDGIWYEVNCGSGSSGWIEGCPRTAGP